MYRNYPLAKIHPTARAAAIAAQCAAIAGHFPEYYQYVFSHQDSLASFHWPAVAAQVGIADTLAFNVCLTSPGVLASLRADSLAAVSIQLRGTPTVLINRWRLNEAPTGSVLEYYFQKELAASHP